MMKNIREECNCWKNNEDITDASSEEWSDDEQEISWDNNYAKYGNIH